MTLNSDHFHSRQKLCDIIDQGLAQQQQQPGRGGGRGPTDANMRIAGGREVRTGGGDIAKLVQNVQLGAPATSSSQAARCGPVWPLSCLSSVPAAASAHSHFAGVATLPITNIHWWKYILS